MLALIPLALAAGLSRADFATPPDSARPWVYWYFMEGQMSKAGMTADLEAMRRVGIGGGIFLEVDLGLPKGPVRYMTPEWRETVAHGAREADRLGMEIALGTGPGWCGTGGPWVKPEDAMQHLVARETTVKGPVKGVDLPRPAPRTPYFGMGTLTPELQKEWEAFYRDEAVLAFPASARAGEIPDLDEKALYRRDPFSSMPGVRPNFEGDDRKTPGIPKGKVIDLTAKRKGDRLEWNVPPGNWTIVRLGRTLTGQTTRPAPAAGLGFETDKFSKSAIERHLDTFVDALVKEIGPLTPGRGLTTLHFDSWEMGSQNASPGFLAEFRRRRGYDPTPYLPALIGRIVESANITDRFLWDLRQTAQELVIENHMGPIRERAKRYGLNLSVEPYDLNPTADLRLGSTADVPMGEFWSKGYGYDTEYSVFEAVSVAHTNGRPIVGAESFTSDDRDGWLQHPASMKAQTDWALAAGINRFVFHRYQHQPNEGKPPGLTMGPYGVHWERTETWWDLSAAYHRYIARCQNLLRQGQPAADILYLAPEGAPNVFQPSSDATVGELPDRRGFGFDGCDPETLIERAKAKDGRIAFPDGTEYRMLVLPRRRTMTPRLLRKVTELAKGGVTVVGNPPASSPSLEGYPACDGEVDAIRRELWSSGHLVQDLQVHDVPWTLGNAKWIWQSVGDPAASAPVGKRTFRRAIRVSDDRTLASARFAFTADNTFHLRVNGTEILSGTDFHRIQTADVAKRLRPGDNLIEVEVENEGERPNPAGLLGAIELRYADGFQGRIETDDKWETEGGVKELGPWTMAPWNLNSGVLPRPELYPGYARLSSILRTTLSTVPDVDSGEALRFSHRRVGDADVYFVGNRKDTEYEGEPAFRVEGKSPEWWDPMTGETRPLPAFRREGGVTRVPLRLDGYGSGFVVFRPDGRESATGENFPKLDPVAYLTGPWEVSFDPKFGGPAAPVAFASLTDWKDRSEPAIRFYSGKAVYRKSFDAPNGGDEISLGEVRNIASVRLNGQEVGVAWCAPWRLKIPTGVLKSTGNRLEITVANLWVNRLIGDAGKPDSERITSTTWSPYRADSPLQPSGLLGPVRILGGS